MTAQEMVSAIRAGGTKYYDALYTEHLPIVRGFLRKRYPWMRVHERADCAHDALSYAFEHLDEFDPKKGAFTTWVCWQACRAANAVMRPRERARFESLDDETSGQPSGRDALVARRERKVLDRRLLLMLNLLPKRQRHVVILCVLKHHTMAYAQERLGLTKRRVEYALHCALGQLPALYADFRD